MDIRPVQDADMLSCRPLAPPLWHDLSMRDAVLQELGRAAGTVEAALVGLELLNSLSVRLRDTLLLGLGNPAAQRLLPDALARFRAKAKTIVEQSTFNGRNLLHRQAEASGLFPVMTCSLKEDGRSVAFGCLALDLDNIAVTADEGDEGILTTRYYGPHLARPYRLMAPTGKPVPDHAVQPSELANDATLIGLSSVLLMIRGRIIEAAGALRDFREKLEHQQAAIRKSMMRESGSMGRLVVEDMQEDSARLQALKARKSLYLQALHIANEEPRRITDIVRAT
jgi:hypothetical protein